MLFTSFGSAESHTSNKELAASTSASGSNAASASDSARSASDRSRPQLLHSGSEY